MYTAQNTISYILKELPDFTSKWNQYLKDCDTDEEEQNIHGDMDVFFYFISDKLKNGEDYNYQLVFSLIEDLLVNGDKEVSEAVAMMFLESMLTIAAHGNYKVESFFNYLGKESKAFCKSNEEFWGIENSKFYKDK